MQWGLIIKNNTKNGAESLFIVKQKMEVGN
jgi:hypothetical protein